MKFLRNALLCISLLLFALLIFENGAARNAVRDALEMCAASVIPALFPFAVIVETVCALKVKRVSKIITLPLEKLLGIPPALAFPFLLGMLGGFPMGALAARRTYEAGDCTEKEAAYVCALSNNPSPAFLFGVVGEGVFARYAVGAFLVAVNLLSVFFTSIVLRLTGHHPLKQSVLKAAKVREEMPFSVSIITTSVKNAGMSMLAVTSYVVFFSAVSEVFFGGRSGVSAGVLSGMLEMTGGLFRLGDGLYLRELIAAAFILGFGGFSVICQVAGILSEAGIPTGAFFFSRLTLGFFNAFFTLFAMLFVPNAVPSGAFIGGGGMSVTSFGNHFLLSLSMPAAAFLLFGVCMLIDKLVERWKFLK